MINCLRDSIHVLMSVFLCKIHCPLLSSNTLKLENTPHASLKTLVSATSDDDDDDHEELLDHVDCHEVREQEDGVVDAKDDAGQIGGDDTITLKSSLRKNENREKKKVQWVDMIGKELAEIREFENRLVFSC